MGKQQCCNACGAPLPLGHGHLCSNCRRARRQEPPKVGSIGREIAAKRAEVLIELVVQEPSTTAPSQIVATVAAEQLAAAWGVKLKRAR